MTIKNGWYRHFKGGYYYVVCMAKHSETLEDMVVYYHKDSPDEIWVRPASMWEEIVNGKPRFEFIGDNNYKSSDGNASYSFEFQVQEISKYK